MLLSRKSFALPERPEKAAPAVAACARYQLFVNDRHVGSGPVRSAPHRQSCDMLEIAKALSKGANVLVFRVHRQSAGVSYYSSSRGGLLAQRVASNGSSSPRSLRSHGIALRGVGMGKSRFR